MPISFWFSARQYTQIYGILQSNPRRGERLFLCLLLIRSIYLFIRFVVVHKSTQQTCK